MSETYENTGTENDDATRGLGTVEVSSTTSYFGTDEPGAGPVAPRGESGVPTGGTAEDSDAKEVAKEEARPTGQQAKEGARHVADVGKDEVKNVTQETTQQAKELWQQTRSQLMDQSVQQQTRVAEGLRSLSQELSGMASGSEQQGVASDLAKQASTRMDDVATWLDQRDPGSLVSEVKQFARQRPGAFLATAAVIGLVGGRLSRGLVADHQEQAEATSHSGTTGSVGASAPTPVDHSTSGYSAYGSASGTDADAGIHPVSDPLSPAGGVHGGTGPLSGSGAGAGESLR